MKCKVYTEENRPMKAKESMNWNSDAALEQSSEFVFTKKQAETFILFFSFTRQPKNFKTSYVQ